MDSTVCAALLNKALGKDQVTALHIDNGFMRYKESDKVIEALQRNGLHVRSTVLFVRISTNSFILTLIAFI